MNKNTVGFGMRDTIYFWLYKWIATLISHTKNVCCNVLYRLLKFNVYNPNNFRVAAILQYLSHSTPFKFIKKEHFNILNFFTRPFGIVYVKKNTPERKKIEIRQKLAWTGKENKIRSDHSRQESFITCLQIPSQHFFFLLKEL